MLAVSDAPDGAAGGRGLLPPTHIPEATNANGPSVLPTTLGPTDTTEGEGRGCSLVNAGLGVRDLVEAGDLKPEGVAPLALVHVVPEGQDHL